MSKKSFLCLQLIPMKNCFKQYDKSWQKHEKHKTLYTYEKNRFLVYGTGILGSNDIFGVRHQNFVGYKTGYKIN